MGPDGETWVDSVVQAAALQGCGKAADLEMNDSPGILRTPVFEGAEKKGGADRCIVGPFLPGSFLLVFSHKSLFPLTWKKILD